jgi:hypothetical protein
MCARSARAGGERRKRATGSTGLSSRSRRQSLQIGFEVCLVDFEKFTPFERIDACLDLEAQGFELQRILPATLLKRAQRIADRFAGILIFARLHHLLDEGIMLRRRLMFRVGMSSSMRLHRIMHGKICRCAISRADFESGELQPEQAWWSKVRRRAQIDFWLCKIFTASAGAGPGFWQGEEITSDASSAANLQFLSVCGNLL